MNDHTSSPTNPAATSPCTAGDAGFSVRAAGAITTAGAGAVACARAISELSRVGDPGPQAAVGPATVILRELADALDVHVPPEAQPAPGMVGVRQVHAACVLAAAAADTLTATPSPPSTGTWAAARALALAAITTWTTWP